MARPKARKSTKLVAKKATRKSASYSRASVGKKAMSQAAILKQNLPGFHIVKVVRSDAASNAEDNMKTAKGPSLKALRSKFLGKSDSTDSADDGSSYSPVDTKVSTARIAPKKGGPAKTADFRDGKVTIVQG